MQAGNRNDVIPGGDPFYIRLDTPDEVRQLVTIVDDWVTSHQGGEYGIALAVPLAIRLRDHCNRT